jgi:predicted amidohydrolase YtcJ
LKTVVFGVFFILAMHSPVGDPTAAAPADLIIVGGTIHTLQADAPRVEAVAISGGMIIATGARAEVERLGGPSTRVIDARGLTVIPGLVDAHAHMTGLGNKLAQIDLVGTGSAGEIRRMVLERAKTAGRDEWIEGRGWDQNDWDVKEFPAWSDLAGTESHPVCLRRVDGHAVWVNRRAMEVCGITGESLEPAGGRILRDEAGEPTGIFVDNAATLITERIPEVSFAERVRRLKLAAAECVRCGLTGVHDAGVGKKALEALRYLEERGELGLRIYAMLDADEAEFADSVLRAGPPAGEGRMVTVRALKLYADGALGSRGAALLEPYSDESGHRGLFVHSREELLTWTRLALEGGYQVCTHAIGDAANRLMLDVYEEALRSANVDDPRLRIEHAQLLAPGEVERFSRLGVIASMQPTHATSDMYWAGDRLGAERLDGAYAWRALLDSGCVIACGSDFPVEAVDPLCGIYAAVTRKDQSGWPEGGWHGDQCMTVDEAVRGFTVNAAYASFMENLKGLLQPDMVADITVLDKDIYEVPPAEILECRIAYTIVGGRVVYAAGTEKGKE